MAEEQKEPIETVGFISADPPELPPDPNGGDFNIDGNVSFGSNLYVSGISTFAGNVNFLGGSDGTIVFGDTSGDNIDFKGDIISNIIPNTTNLYDIGSTLQRWKDGYFDGTVTATDFNSTSDKNLKTNIQIINNPLDKVLQLNGYTFNWKETNKESIGVIAQELEEILPELVIGFSQKSVNYNGIIAVLIESIKELNQKVEGLTEEVRSLRMTE